jgi:hypothetical protein
MNLTYCICSALPRLIFDVFELPTDLLNFADAVGNESLLHSKDSSNSTHGCPYPETARWSLKFIAGRRLTRGRPGRVPHSSRPTLVGEQASNPFFVNFSHENLAGCS